MSNIPDKDQSGLASQHTLTPADIAGFANTLDAIQDSDRISDADKMNLCEALDRIADLVNARDPLTVRALNSWLPDFLHVGEPKQASVKSTNEQAAIEQPTGEHDGLDSHDLEGPLQHLVCELTLDDDDRCEAFIAIMRLIDMADDDDKCLITALAIDFAYTYTTNSRHSLHEYLSDMGNRSADFAQLVAAIPNRRRSNHASNE